MFNPIPFDPVHDAALLRAAGYVHEHHAADWWDDGDSENGPHLSGHPAADIWSLGTHEIVVVDGEVVSAEDVPPGPLGWEDQFPGQEASS